MKFRGYRANQRGGACLVTVVDELGEEKVLLPTRISPRHEVRHSPDGFQWGYAGSGPAELARAILVRAIEGDDRARHPRCYQKYKAEVIQRIKRDEFELSFKSVQEWYEQWLVEHGKDVEPGWRA
jgi:hypothetical protein